MLKDKPNVFNTWIWKYITLSRDKRTRGLGLYSAKSDNADSIYSVAVLMAAVSSCAQCAKILWGKT